MANSTARVGGSGFTFFKYRGNVIGYAQAIGYTSPQPVAQAVPVQPMNKRRPVEVVTPNAISYGTLTVTFIEHWNTPVWARLGFKANDLADVFAAQWAQDQSALHGSVVVKGPGGAGKGRYLVRHFQGLKAVDIRDDENVDITTMLLNKPVTFWYRKSHFAYASSSGSGTAKTTGVTHLFAGTSDDGQDTALDTEAASGLGDTLPE
jgi:hypothetical protein